MKDAAPMPNDRLEDIAAVAEAKDFVSGAQARELIAEVRRLRSENAKLAELLRAMTEHARLSVAKVREVLEARRKRSD